MEIYSNKLNETIPAENCGKFFLVKHSDLEKAAAKLKADYGMEIISMQKNHAVVICTVEYKETQYSTIGEATEATLWDDTDKEYPVTMAWNRAFDRAIIKLLNFNEVVFSNKEIKKERFVKKRENTSERAEVIKDNKGDNESTPKTKEPVKAKQVNSAPAVSTEKTCVKKIERNKNTHSQVISFGRWNGYTFQEAEKEEGFKEWVQWLKSACVHFDDPKKEKQVQYLLKHY